MSTSYTWNGVSGDWNNGSNWTPPRHEEIRISTSPGAVRLLFWSLRAFTARFLISEAEIQSNSRNSWRFSAISAEIGGVTTLTLHRGSTTHDFEFVGDYTRSDFSITPGKITTIKFG